MGFPPSLFKALQTQTAEAGSSIRLGARIIGSEPAYSHWYFNGTNLFDAATNTLLQLTNLQFFQAGTYTVVITNLFGIVTSAPAVLNVIPAVDRRLVPAIQLTGEAGSWLTVDCADYIHPSPSWTALGSMSLTSGSQYYFDLTSPMPPQRFYRIWQTGTPSAAPSLNLSLVPVINLTGNVGDSLRLDYINAIGPTNAWVNLDALTLTNASQPYFDISALGQPRRLYRIVSAP